MFSTHPFGASAFGATGASAGPMEVDDAITFSDALQSNTSEGVDGGVIALSEAINQNPDLVFETITVDDSVEITRAIFVADSFEVSDAMQWSSELGAWEAIRFGDATQQVTAQFVSDTVAFADAVEHSTTQLVSDAIAIIDTQEHLSASAHEIEDRISVSDAVSQGSVTEAADTIAFTEAIEQVASAEHADAIAFTDAVEHSTARPGHEVEDVIACSDAIESVRLSTIEIADTIHVTDAMFHKDPRAVAWVLNTESGAPYWYSNWQISDMAQAGDKVFAVGPEGLLLVGADTDDGADIDASVGHGFMDLGSGQKTRVDAFWFGYTSTDVLKVSVETYGQGYPPYPYEMQPVPADQPRNNRIKPGKGLNARYWRLTLNNVGGCDFSVNETSADLAVSSRRI